MYNLFHSDKPEELLPFDGSSVLYNGFLSSDHALFYYKALNDSIEWRQDEIFMFGKRIITSRKVGWYADKPYRYIYSRTQKIALPWTPELMEIKAKVERESGATYNSCLLNLYHNGSEAMGWHADNEKSLDSAAPIASVSLGATRTFRFKHKYKELKSSIDLTSGSLLVMHPPTQEYWLHALSKTTTVKSPRINLTFRTMLPQEGL